LTNLIPLSKTKKIQNLALTSFNKATSKIPAYLNNIIIIIIFLIFLNLFITTYFYFTTSIQATANRSNCGGASLCEAETHRHLFLEDNGNDKARDIYIIIVVIFSIYLLSEIFKSYKDGIKFDDDENTISVVPILILFLYFIFIVGTISGIIDKAKSNNKNPEGINVVNVVSSALFMFYLFVIGIILYSTEGVKNALDRNYPSKIIMFLTVTIPLAIIGVEIGILAEGPRYDLFKGFSGDKFNLINPKFKANTALHIIFLVFYIIFFVVVVWFNKNIKALHIWGLVFLAFILFTLFTFILLSSLDFKNTNYTDWLKNITGSTLGMQYFVLLFPLLILYPFNLNISSNAIKLIVLYYVILFIIYLFYVYFVNHSNETGILSLESFQLYNWANEHKNENKKGSNSESNHKKDLNKVNTFFVAVLLIILIFIGGLNEDSNLDNIIYGIIVFILASYITGIVYLLYNELFPIQQASFNYKKNLVDINNKISQHIKVEEVEHTIDKNKIRVFKIANDNNELKDIHERIKGTEKQDKEMHMKNIRDIFSEISPKGSSYEDYRSQSTDQMQYEEYIYRLFSNWTNTDFKFQPNFYETIFGDDDFEQDSVADTYRLNSYILYNSIILKLPKNKAELIEYMKDNDVISTSIKKIEANTEANIFIQEVFKIPKTNNIEYVIKKNYKYVTGEEGVIQKYNSDREMTQDNKNALYWIKLTNTSKKGFHYHNMYFGAKDTTDNYTSATDWYKVDDNPGDSKRRFFSAFKYDTDTLKTSPGDHNNDDEIRNMLSNSSQADIFEEIRLSSEYKSKIKMENNILYKMKISEFNKIKEQVKDKDRVYFMVFEDTQTKNINCYVSYNITNPKSSIKITSENSYIDPINITELQDYIDKTDPVLAPFYTIGYNYENHTRDHQQMNKDTAYSIPARYYACSYLNYFPNEDGSMSKVKFAKNIKEDNYNPLNTKNTIIDRIAKSYNENAKETKIQLAPEKFQFLLVFLVILAIILLIFLFNIIKKYFTGDVYTPQMYVLGILGVFLTIFIFGEVIFARIK